MGLSEIVTTLDLIIKGFGGQYSTTIYVEEVALQGWLTRELQSKNFLAVGVKIHGLDKRTRLGMTTNRMQLGKILFCNPGTDILQNQMLKFGMLKHDDVVDAYSTLIQGIAENEAVPQTVEMIKCVNMYRKII
jgi:phage terminase large subunit-like protein